MTLPMKLHDWVNINKINWYGLSGNPNAIDLSYNPNAMELLKKNLDKIDWFYMSINPNPKRN